MDEYTKIAKNALEQIVGYYRRSHKHGSNTIYQMYREAEVALQEMSRLTQRATDGDYCLCPPDVPTATTGDGVTICTYCHRPRR